jgi:hypothetical protein
MMNTPTTQKANNLKTILTNFVEASGTSLNLDNSQLFFFNASMAIQTHIYRLLGIPKSSLPSNCLVIPLTGAAIHIISWDNLMLSISNHLNNWIFFSLSLSARLVLLKYVLQELPTYLFTTLTTP